MILLTLIFSKFSPILFMQSVEIWPPREFFPSPLIVEDDLQYFIHNPAVPCRIYCIEYMQFLEVFFLQVTNTVCAICLELVTPFVNIYFTIWNYIRLYYYDSSLLGNDPFIYGNLLVQEHLEAIREVNRVFKHITWFEHVEIAPLAQYIVYEFGFAVVYAETAMYGLVCFFTMYIYDHYKPFITSSIYPFIITCSLYLLNWLALGFMCYLFPCGACYSYSNFVFLTVYSYVSIIWTFVAFPITFIYVGYRVAIRNNTATQPTGDVFFDIDYSLRMEHLSDPRALRPPHVKRDIAKISQAITPKAIAEQKDEIKQCLKDLPPEVEQPQSDSEWPWGRS